MSAPAPSQTRRVALIGVAAAMALLIGAIVLLPRAHW